MKKQIIISTTNELVRVLPERIVYISSDGNYSTMVLHDKTEHLFTFNLSHFAVSDEEDDSEGRIYTNYLVEFCGYFPAENPSYFPAENPKYSIIVSINKRGLPVSGGLMAGSVFSEIVDYMVAE